MAEHRILVYFRSCTFSAANTRSQWYFSHIFFFLIEKRFHSLRKRIRNRRNDTMAVREVQFKWIRADGPFSIGQPSHHSQHPHTEQQQQSTL